MSWNESVLAALHEDLEKAEQRILAAVLLLEEAAKCPVWASNTDNQTWIYRTRKWLKEVKDE